MELAQEYSEQRNWLKQISWFDWLYAAFLVAGSVYAYRLYGSYMDGYEQGILVLIAGMLLGLGWYWKPVRTLMIVVTGVSLFSISLYQGQLPRAEQVFWLKFLISSQSAIMWMSALFVLATVTYWIGLIARSEFTYKVASSLTWSAVTMGLVGLMVRWYESYLISPDVGHIPISNLYEVFILFSIITSLLYLFYEKYYQNRQMGAFVLLVISAAVGFLLWYTFGRQAYEIQPLVPALQSYWMKLHVPANFIGYGSFALAAMIGVAYIFVSKGMLVSRLPSLDVLDDVMYKAITIGFAFFTIATVLGAMWAAEAWGGYWSWDPKETWALIVWLNYAAWLHIRLVKGLRGPMLAWWAIVGLLVTAFAFLGVNMFLSGLHSYGTL
ncbi:c-type cytochrome biogenesis protein CcsB [Sulfurirhabdus autotrophica]|uniref:Cytochrome c-type biogenesis protein CcsB n=1 Tax=Sulfurirhabdus autotrophica TaxID=1706046 RepID=A0A4R3XVX8_9PROT|nr:c-type cytochrome biogenesis protein CcsB [Sulfurirhabdus autotrophica]TCV82378.1 cytochrome c-type biogenesis protein CcsB [Sulfurirhabdus autotrophica]